MKKIGIITHYYRSSNYGGNLQAYALVQFLRANGYDAEQISYDRSDDRIEIARPWYVRMRYNAINTVIRWLDRSAVKERNAAIQGFNQAIAHSETVSYHSIGALTKKYDVLISGSDQVWHPQAVCHGYLLDFETDAKRLSYAASFAVNEIPENLKETYAESLKRFAAISVREEVGIGLVKELAGMDATRTLDPTLLLPAEKWEQICENTDVQGKYLFCYFLGDSELQRKSAEEYARKHALKIVTIPYLNGKKRSCDVDFGDERIYAASPGQLLSLIKNAACVLTDSFHVTLFSIVFRKNFITMERTQFKEMSSRLHTLLSLFDLEDRFCDEKRLERIGELETVRYQECYPKFEREKEKSIDFLLGNIERD